MQRSLVFLVMLFVLTFAGVREGTHVRENQRHTPDWNLIPYSFDGWQGEATNFDPTYGFDPADTSLWRVYRERDGGTIIIYIGYYSDLATILDVHTPELCYPAQGWSISSTRKTSGGVFRGRAIPAKEIVVDKSGAKRRVVWWYNAGSRPFENRIRYVWAMLMMSTLTGRADGSLVRIESPIDARGDAAAEERIERFRKKLVPELEKALP